MLVPRIRCFLFGEGHLATKKAAPAKAAKKAPAKAASKSSSDKPTRVGPRHLAEGIVATYDLSKKDALAIVTGVFEDVGKRLQKGEVIAVSGFGRFVVRDRAARIGRNPQTGEAVKIPAKRTLRFTPAKPLKEAVLKKKK
jgi:DNA-binding protein HU-beta